MSDATSLVKMASGSAESGENRTIERNSRRIKTKFIPKLMKFAGKIPFADDLAAAWYCAQDPATPLHVKGVLLAALAYFVMPADIVPDVIMGFGFTDDATVLAAALSVVGTSIKPRHERQARRLLRLPKPKSDQKA